MKNLRLLFLLSLIFIGCQQEKQEGYILEGFIEGEPYNDYIFLGLHDGYRDSVKVENNRFYFSGKQLDMPRSAWLNLRPRANIQFVYIENGHIKIEATYKQEKSDNNITSNILEIIEIEGSETAKLQEECIAFVKGNREKENYNNLLFAQLKGLFTKYPQQPYWGDLLRIYSASEPTLSYDQLMELIQLVDTAYIESHNLNFISKGLITKKNYIHGSPFPDFSLNNQEDIIIKNSDLEGKFILVDFWASWCGPCRKKHPEMIEFYEKNKDKGFEILGISIDNDKEPWLTAIGKDKINWLNVIDIQATLSGEMGIVAIPFQFLLDKDGDILKVNPTIDDLEKYLSAI
ncbi:MAG: redoxin family protein [Bacteroidota bacterium]